MNNSLRTQLHDLALLWCRLTGRLLEDFEREFHSQLAAINRFTGLFPRGNPADLAAGLHTCVMGSLRMKFSADEIDQARMGLEPDGAGVSA